MNHSDVLTSSSLSSSSTSTSISSSSSSFVTSDFVEPVDPSHDVILLPRSVHQRLLQELCAGKTKLRVMDNLQRLLRQKVDELERTRERLENCQGALLRCERRLCDVIAQQTMSFRNSSVSNISNIVSSPYGRQGHAECGAEDKRSDRGEEDRAKGTDASTNTETEITYLEKPGLAYPYLGLASEQFLEMFGDGLATDANEYVSLQLRKMTKVENEGAPASVFIPGFSASPAKSDSRGVEHESPESSGANQTSLPHPGQGQWHWQPSATPNLEKSSSKTTTDLARRRVSVAFSKDLISKLIQQNVRLKTTMKQLLGYKGLTITQYLDTQEQLDIIEQLRQEIRLARIQIQQLEGREKTLRLNQR